MTGFVLQGHILLFYWIFDHINAGLVTSFKNITKSYQPQEFEQYSAFWDLPF